MTDILFMRPVEAAQYLRLSTSTLAKMRIRGTGPSYTKAGSKLVLYKKVDLNTWLQDRQRISTSENPAFEVLNFGGQHE